MVVAFTAAACSSTSPETAPPQGTTTTTIGSQWNAPARERGNELHAELTAAGVKCDSLEEFSRPEFLVTFIALKWPVPLWAAHCTLAGGEDLQLEIYSGTNAVERRESTRRERFCEAEADRRPPSLSYVAGSDFLLTPDTNAMAEKIAPVVDGVAREQTCSGEPPSPKSGDHSADGKLNGIAWSVETGAGPSGTTCWRLTTTPPATPSRLVVRDGRRCFMPPTIESNPGEWFEVPFVSSGGDVEAVAFVVPPGSVTAATVTLDGGTDAPAFVDPTNGLVVYTAPAGHTVGLVTLSTDDDIFDCGPGEIFTPDDVRERTAADLKAERLDWPWACTPR